MGPGQCPDGSPGGETPEAPGFKRFLQGKNVFFAQYTFIVFLSFYVKFDNFRRGAGWVHKNTYMIYNFNHFVFGNN